MEAIIGPWQISIQRVWATNEELAQKYNNAASSWHERIQRLGFLKAYGHLFEQLQQDGVLSHLRYDSAVLDSGIGTAALSLALSSTLPVKLQLFGVDLSTEMVYKARTFLREAGVKGSVRQGDGQALSFTDNSFDFVMSAHLLEHLPEPKQALQEMVRLLKPGTPLLLVVSQPGIFTILNQLRWQYVAYKADEVMALMSEVGLSDIRGYKLRGALPSRISLAYVGTKKKV